MLEVHVGSSDGGEPVLAWIKDGQDIGNSKRLITDVRRMKQHQVHTLVIPNAKVSRRASSFDRPLLSNFNE